ncbi:MAG: NAD-dependent epimerase/dehydratase family protein [Bryobacterales bacterium]|nr:NAD-dependent epimerase/dehydratase family protein [Bryobacterales bacterium]
MLNLVTGGAGFIGSHLCEHLLHLGEAVEVWDDLSTGSLANLAGCIGHPRFSYVVSDFTQDRNFASAVSRCDQIFHLAAAVGVKKIVTDPAHTIVTNVQGTEIVLRYAAPLRKPVLLTSTSEVYGKGTRVPFREDDDVLYGPTSKSRWSYAMSKAIDEFLLMAYSRTHSLPGVIVRLFNTVGPRQVKDYGMVLPSFVSQALNGGPLTIFGDGQQTRCFAHVLDVVPALVKLSRTPAAWGRVVNIGSTEEVSIIELAERIRGAVCPGAPLAFLPYDRAYEPGFEDMIRRVPDIGLARDLIGFQPVRNLDAIIADSVAHQVAKQGSPNRASVTGLDGYARSFDTFQAVP